MTMPDIKDYLATMGSTLDKLTKVEKELLKLSTGDFVASEINALQSHQDALVQELLKVDSSLKEKYGGEYRNIESSRWSKIHEKLELFENLNENFIKNLSIRQHIIKVDLKDIKKTRKSLSEVKSAYRTPRTSKAGKTSKRKHRINTVL